MAEVSVIMPAHNSGRFIYSSIRSVQFQSFQDWELIVSDDGSSDETLSVAKSLASEDQRIKVLSSSSQLGAANARNAAIASSEGRYIAFLDSDDVWKPEKLQKQIAFMKREGVHLSFSSYDRMDENGNYINTIHVYRPISYKDLIKASYIGCLTAVYDTKKFGKVFMPNMKMRQDFALWLTLLKRVEFAHPLEESLAQYRIRAGSLSYRKLKTVGYTWSVYREAERMGWARSSYSLARYLFHGVRRSYLQPLFDHRKKTQQSTEAGPIGYIPPEFLEHPSQQAANR